MITATASPSSTTAPPAVTHFDRTTVLRRVQGSAPAGTAVLLAELDESWASLRGIHGGYTAALAVLAASSIADGRPVRTVATSFLRPGHVGTAEIHVRTLRHGRSLTTVDASVLQDGNVNATSRITFAAHVGTTEWRTPLEHGPRPIEHCVSFEPPPGIRHFEQAALLLDPATIPAGGADDARIAGHVRPIEARPIDAAWLTMIGDWFPPAAFRRLVPPAGGVSVDYTVHIHREIASLGDGWLQGVFDATTAQGGMALEHGLLATADGTPVAETFHTRWTA